MEPCGTFSLWKFFFSLDQVLVYFHILHTITITFYNFFKAEGFVLRIFDSCRFGNEKNFSKVDLSCGHFTVWFSRNVFFFDFLKFAFVSTTAKQF